MLNTVSIYVKQQNSVNVKKLSALEHYFIWTRARTRSFSNFKRNAQGHNNCYCINIVSIADHALMLIHNIIESN